LLEKPGLTASLAVSDHPFKGNSAGTKAGRSLLTSRNNLRLRAEAKMASMITCVSTYTGSMISSARRLFRMFGPGLVTGAADDEHGGPGDIV
jgi:hypothetical protein